MSSPLTCLLADFRPFLPTLPALKRVSRPKYVLRQIATACRGFPPLPLIPTRSLLVVPCGRLARLSASAQPRLAPSWFTQVWLSLLYPSGWTLRVARVHRR